ncbi:MAG: hypothetical protein JNJ48_04870 [Phycisphaerae bacterium]|nr:hypothetical protein [Phycisphaerae bacterium]
MARFLIPLMFVWFAVGAIALVQSHGSSAVGGYAFELAGVIELAIVPVVAAWLAAELADRRRRRRWLTPDAGWLGPTGMGLCAGVTGVAMAAGFLLVVPDAWPDGFVIASASAAASFGSVRLSPAQRASFCPLCGYDRSGATPASRGLCPECGHDAFAVR